MYSDFLDLEIFCSKLANTMNIVLLLVIFRKQFFFAQVQRKNLKKKEIIYRFWLFLVVT